MKVDLSEHDWQLVINLMAYAPGRECIPLINRITAQLQRAQMQAESTRKTVKENDHPDVKEFYDSLIKGNSGERQPGERSD